MIASAVLSGRLAFLPTEFSVADVLMMTVVARFIVDGIVFRRIRKSLPGNFLNRVLILGFISVLLFHAFRNQFGMKALGSPVWGGRGYVECLLGLAAYYIIRKWRISPKSFRLLPLVAVFMAG